MRLKALANISGGSGDRVIGEVFDASAEIAEVLLKEGWAERVDAKSDEAKAKKNDAAEVVGQ